MTCTFLFSRSPARILRTTFGEIFVQLCDHLTIVLVVTFRLQAIVLAEYDNGNNVGYWVSKAKRQWKQQRKA